MDYTDYLKLIAALVTSIGGTTVIVIALSKWFGDFISKRLLDNYNNKHSSELEKIKNKYQKELESSKSELDKSKSLFLRYSEKQFVLYNDLWKVLLYTKQQADSLWEKTTSEKIPSFIEQIQLTKNAIDDNMLLIEKAHYNKLSELIEQFEKFKIATFLLRDLKNKSSNEIEEMGITQDETLETITNNIDWKKKYDNLIMEIGINFRQQIKG
ncbi:MULTISPECIES: hypothetical protein [unclassified Empedobacter]|uniref:hypothetical protein n=1 Tax=unclassified Empedobacter TaxID=2643773 RepID=UPI0025C2FD4F|nr:MULTISPECIES: hypothetical protein [unclassified Empedobacter]